MSKEPELFDLVDRLSNLADAYDAISYLTGSADDVVANRVSMLMLPVNEALSDVLQGFEKLRKKGRTPLLDT